MKIAKCPICKKTTLGRQCVSYTKPGTPRGLIHVECAKKKGWPIPYGTYMEKLDLDEILGLKHATFLDEELTAIHHILK